MKRWPSSQKAVYLLATIIALALLSGLVLVCFQAEKFKSKSSTLKIQLQEKEEEIKLLRGTIDSLFVFPSISTGTDFITFSNKNELKEVYRGVPWFALPAGIDSEQVYGKEADDSIFFRLKDVYLTFFRKSNMHYPIDSSSERAGVLWAREGDRAWKILVELKDAPGTLELRNNPLYLWKEGEVLLLLITDDGGAGSGEGAAKLLVSKDGGKNWEIQKCFYFAFDCFFGYYSGLGPNKALEEGRSFTEVYKEFSSRQCYYKEDIFNPKTGKYEFEQTNRETGEIETFVADDCQNFKLLTVNPIDF